MVTDVLHYFMNYIMTYHSQIISRHQNVYTWGRLACYAFIEITLALYRMLFNLVYENIMCKKTTENLVD